ncbi:MAG: hypothetical protein A2W99_02700 [Bacteroidetes bacterium GWF2_33_16]|nr:MAG: hypothetical protein A2X00_07895 [Bacteroidetes bacterium GWE2_32_14]OFY07376.1 MAG: hypothetical protein A2W99_02700 [Bacteroidetes bacterium GWF2_33_16]
MNMKKYNIFASIVCILSVLPLNTIFLKYQQRLNFLGPGIFTEKVNPNNDLKVNVLITDIAIASFYSFLQVKSTINGPYLGQKLPGLVPKIFAKDLISTNEIESKISITDNGKKIYIERIIDGKSCVTLYKMNDTGWSDAIIDNKTNNEIFGILFNGIAQKLLLEEKILNNPDIFNGHLLVAPDESYIIFSGKSEGASFNKLKISFRNNKGDWCQPLNLSEVLKTPQQGDEQIGIISPDGKYLFFIVAGDIFWVDTKIINILRPKEID